jgi:hypothetical protein
MKRLVEQVTVAVELADLTASQAGGIDIEQRKISPTPTLKFC